MSVWRPKKVWRSSSSEQGGAYLIDSTWETVSAFANTRGGYIVFGIYDDEHGNFYLEGVKNPDRLVKLFFDQLRNLNKINHSACGAEDVITDDIEGIKVVRVRVRRAPRRTGPVYIGKNPFTGTYVRRHEGDYHATPQEIERMIREKSVEKADSSVLPHMSVGALDIASVVSYRRRYALIKQGHVWNGYDDERFLQAIEAYGIDTETGVAGITVAGLLMFGTPEAIRSWRTRHIIDFRYRLTNERWDDRIVHEGNLYQAYEIIDERLRSKQPVPFKLQDGVRAGESPMHEAVREAFVNLLVHADYAETSASLIVQTVEGYEFRNPGSSLLPEADLFHGDRSDPRNPSVMRMFRYVGISEEAGSGMSTIFSKWTALGYRLPTIYVGGERYEFAVRLSFAHLISEVDREWLSLLGRDLTHTDHLALVIAKNDESVDNERLRRITGLHSTDAGRVLTKLRDEGLLKKERTGRATRYELTEVAQLMVVTPDPDDKRTNTDDNERNPDHSDIDPDDSGIKPDDSSVDSDKSDKYARDMHELRGDLLAQLEIIAQPSRTQLRLIPTTRDAVIVALCTVTPLSVSQIAQLMRRDRDTTYQAVRRLVRAKRLNYLYPDARSRPGQKYQPFDDISATKPKRSL